MCLTPTQTRSARHLLGLAANTRLPLSAVAGILGHSHALVADAVGIDADIFQFGHCVARSWWSRAEPADEDSPLWPWQS